jgi:hypothetical protein
MSHICVTCGTQYPRSDEPPANCPICEDERQYVGPLGQKWVSLDGLQKRIATFSFKKGKSSGEFILSRTLRSGKGRFCCKQIAVAFSGIASA